MPIASVGVLLALGRIGGFGQRLHSFQDPGSVMFKALLRASLLLAPVVAAQAAPPAADLDELHQRQFRYARTMMQLNQLEGFERGPSIDALLEREREAKAKRAEERWRDPGDLRAQSMDAFAEAIERVASDQRAKRTMSRQWQIDEPYPSHWSVSGNEAAAADCARAIEHPLGQPLRIEMNSDGIAWLRLVAPGKGYWAFDTLVSEFDTKLSVYRDCRDIDSAAKQISDDTIGLGSIVGLDAKTAGQTFLIKLERKGGVGSLAIAKSVLAGSISGRVTRASDGAAAQDIRVYAISVGLGYVSASDANGQGEYHLTVYNAGSYYVRAQSRWWDATSVDVPTIYPGAACASTNAVSTQYCDGPMDALVLADDTMVEGINIVLGTSAMLYGLVVDELTAMPISGARVMVVAADDAAEQETWRAVDTDGAGRYRVGGLPARGWRIEFSHPQYASERWEDVPCSSATLCEPATGSVVVTSEGATYSSIVRLQAQPHFNVRISVGGVPASGARVSLYSIDGDYIDSFAPISGSAGLVRVGPLVPGVYRAVASGQGSFRKVLGGLNCEGYCNEEILSGDIIVVSDSPSAFEVDLKPLPILEGRLASSVDGSGIAGASIVLAGGGGAWQTAITNSEGRYRFAAVEPEIRVLHFKAPGFQDEVHDNVVCEGSYSVELCPGATIMAFNLASPPTQVVNATLIPSGRLSGRIKSLAGPSYGTNGYLVQLSQSGQRLAEHAISPSNGRYEFLDVPQGAYYWAYQSGNFYRQIFRGVNCGKYFDASWSNCNLAAAQTITLGSGQAQTGVDFDLLPVGARLVQVADDASGGPIAGVAIDRWDAQGNWIGAALTDEFGRAPAFGSDASGPTAYYAIKLSTDSSGRYIDEVYDDQPCPVGTSVYRGGCSLAGAWTVPISDGGSTPFPPLVIRLRSADPVFASGFE
jgi:hypothetical protein